jgi:hypothetical protein
MAKIECKCGNIINVTNENSEFEIVPGSWVESMCQKIETGSINERSFFESFLSVHQTVYKCSKCDRLWFDENSGVFVAYLPEHKCEESSSKKEVNRKPFWKKIFLD